MCGILGEIVFGGQPLSGKDKFLQLLQLSNSRGPDSTGCYSNNNNIQIGFNRLAIWDLSGISFDN